MPECRTLTKYIRKFKHPKVLCISLQFLITQTVKKNTKTDEHITGKLLNTLQWSLAIARFTIRGFAVSQICFGAILHAFFL